MMEVKLWTICCLMLSGVPVSWTEEEMDLKKLASSQIANIDMIDDVSVIINYHQLREKRVYFTRDCDELYLLGHRKSGVYVIQPTGSPYLVVQCYMYDCGGWTVIQRNSFDTYISWHETWTAYEYGFGNIVLDHYLGNHYIKLLTAQKWYKVRFLLVDSENRTRRADYDSFYLTNATDKYQLKLGTYEGDAGDSLSSGNHKNLHDNMRFSTYDDDNDRLHNVNCANKHGGGWWFDSCYDAHLNNKGLLHWKTLCDHNCRRSVILIKPVHMYCNRV
ncbi:fibrinogen-like protein 1-like protein [Bufo gargarizans]|uniref:fibrinogen-like protein 1-like protein n=1 Tax=Bufo gargarizans TaxID=30331 RepID=UPI001CF40E68|nr:fibrinogen-like protein 1-like protein [Bufo gargarizans]